ncbi:hypothetical protein [Paraburkholderia phenoliruptrix]|uniref:Uncharacterized protein n=2 Tax=Paraburkholderia phenoliruptrix TaxID=252970 RepID=K0DZM7_9BURK|nr:hypothetical protein [Paraburkholderia phenoliruptrix]AFT90087.1 hypothetical protein BUPH_04605 [Paraburkholderia phenoliruptrix BR3459a]CAB4052725.1 hypothetical protein LMG9964_06415 [Paraburkholderia phenoliruptrix]
MSQARQRYAGARQSGKPHDGKKAAPDRRGQPYVKTPPRDSTDTASIFKTRSFQFLVNAVGAENIAIALESNMTRVAELMKGERFTPETAFHMETTLGLPHGFFDQPNPALADETIARLKSPLDFVQIDEGFDAGYEALAPASAETVDPQPVPEDSLSEDAQMLKKVADGSSRAVKKSRNKMPEQPVARAPLKGSRSKDKAAPRTPQQQPLALSDSVEVENIRRANLRLLTSRNGSKVRLGVVMEMSGFNIADRLNGKKRMDSVEASRFTERLGLPVDWLDSPRTEAEIPESVSEMLAPAPRGRASVQQHEPPAPGMIDSAKANHSGGKARIRRERATALHDSDSPSAVSSDVAEDKASIVASPRADVDESPDDLRERPVGENNQEIPAATSAPAVSMPESLPVPATPQQAPTPLPVATVVTSLDTLHGIEPIAEALLKTLAGKARTGRLDEVKALELLQQAVLL